MNALSTRNDGKSTAKCLHCKIEGRLQKCFSLAEQFPWVILLKSRLCSCLLSCYIVAGSSAILIKLKWNQNLCSMYETHTQDEENRSDDEIFRVFYCKLSCISFLVTSSAFSSMLSQFFLPFQNPSNVDSSTDIVS